MAPRAIPHNLYADYLALDTFLALEYAYNRRELVSYLTWRWEVLDEQFTQAGSPD